jgi:hypothetical protein
MGHAGQEGLLAGPRRYPVVEPLHRHQIQTIATEFPRNSGSVATVSVIALMQRGPVVASLAHPGQAQSQQVGRALHLPVSLDRRDAQVGTD